MFAYINTAKGDESFAVDKKTPYFLNDKTILTDRDNNVLAMGAQAVITKLGKGDQVEVTIKGDVMTIKRLATAAQLAAEKAPVGLITEGMDTQIENIDVAFDGSHIVVTVPEEFDFSSISQTPGEGGDENKIYVGVKVEAPVAGKLTKITY